MPFNRAENAIQSADAPKSNGNYSHVIKHGDVLHLCGWMGQDQAGNIVKGGVVAQTVSSRKAWNRNTTMYYLPT